MAHLAAVPGRFRPPARDTLGLVVRGAHRPRRFHSSGSPLADVWRRGGPDGRGRAWLRGAGAAREGSSRDVWVSAPPPAPPLPLRAQGARSERPRPR